MNLISSSILRLGIVTACICVAGTASAQGIEGGRSGTSTADNPALRSHDEPAKTTKAKIVKVSDKDAQFVSDAMTGGEREVQNGKLALSKAQSPEVKKVAERMVQDHSRANDQLAALGKKKGLAVTQGIVKPDNFGTQDFDKRYLQVLEQDHKKDIAEFEKEARNGGDADLKAWAAKTLPTLKAHLAMVRDASKQVK